MLFMVIERFKNRDGAAVYRRARERGRMLPEGLSYLSSAGLNRILIGVSNSWSARTRSCSRCGPHSGRTWFHLSLCRW